MDTISFENPKSYISKQELEQALSEPDLTTPEFKNHAIGQLYSSLENRILQQVDRNVHIIRRDPIMSVTDHFDKLLFPKTSKVRSSMHSRYIDKETLLRGHTASLVSGVIPDFIEGPEKAITLICPGICFRSKREDKEHASVIHQVDIWQIGKEESADPKKDFQRAQAIASDIVKTLLPGYPVEFVQLKTTEKTHPYLSSGFKVKTRNEKYPDGITLFEGGLVSKNWLVNMGLSETACGIAFGIILERTLAIRKHLDDVRLIRSSEPKIQKQMYNLDIFHPLETKHIYTRDLPIAIDPKDVDSIQSKIEEYALQKLGTKIKIELGEITQYETLPTQVIKRYGMLNGQVNILIRVSLLFDSPQGKDSLNTLRDDLYKKFHQGTRNYLEEFTS